MITINQNSYSEIRKAAQNILVSYNKIKNSNFDDYGCFKGDRESLWDGMWNLSDLFDENEKVRFELQYMLKKYKNFGTKSDYEKILNDLNMVRDYIIYDYKSIKDALREFSDSEISRIKEFRIEL